MHNVQDVHTLDYVIFSTLGENLKIVEVRLTEPPLVKSKC